MPAIIPEALQAALKYMKYIGMHHYTPEGFVQTHPEYAKDKIGQASVCGIIEALLDYIHIQNQEQIHRTPDPEMWKDHLLQVLMQQLEALAPWKDVLAQLPNYLCEFPRFAYRLARYQRQKLKQYLHEVGYNNEDGFGVLRLGFLQMALIDTARDWLSMTAQNEEKMLAKIDQILEHFALFPASCLDIFRRIQSKII